jgi:hypothetical protein
MLRHRQRCSDSCALRRKQNAIGLGFGHLLKNERTIIPIDDAVARSAPVTAWQKK